jgi:drug/metabolite transporter (DMT)-like permease
VIISYFLGGEPLGARTMLGGIFVLASVVTITSMRAKTPAVAEDAE